MKRRIASRSLVSSWPRSNLLAAEILANLPPGTFSGHVPAECPPKTGFLHDQPVLQSALGQMKRLIMCHWEKYSKMIVLSSLRRLAIGSSGDEAY